MKWYDVLLYSVALLLMTASIVRIAVEQNEKWHVDFRLYGGGEHTYMNVVVTARSRWRTRERRMQTCSCGGWAGDSMQGWRRHVWLGEVKVDDAADDA